MKSHHTFSTVKSYRYFLSIAIFFIDMLKTGNFINDLLGNGVVVVGAGVVVVVVVVVVVPRVVALVLATVPTVLDNNALNVVEPLVVIASVHINPTQIKIKTCNMPQSFPIVLVN